MADPDGAALAEPAGAADGVGVVSVLGGMGGGAGGGGAGGGADDGGTACTAPMKVSRPELLAA
jgi:hypothetical protein